MQKEFTWLARDAGLQFFGDTRHEALERYHSFILAGVGLDDDIDFQKGMVAGVIGDDLFIESVRQERGSNNATEDKPLEVSLTQLLKAVADWYKIDVEHFLFLEMIGRHLASGPWRRIWPELPKE